MGTGRSNTFEPLLLASYYLQHPRHFRWIARRVVLDSTSVPTEQIEALAPMPDSLATVMHALYREREAAMQAVAVAVDSIIEKELERQDKYLNGCTGICRYAAYPLNFVLKALKSCGLWPTSGPRNGPARALLTGMTSTGISHNTFSKREGAKHDQRCTFRDGDAAALDGIRTTLKAASSRDSNGIKQACYLCARSGEVELAVCEHEKDATGQKFALEEPIESSI